MKLILTDLDGTLLPPGEKQIAGAVIETVNALHARGVAFAVASGRAQSELIHLFAAVEDTLYFLPCDGALVYRGRSLLQEAAFDKAALLQFDAAKTVLLHSRYCTYVKGQAAFVREMKLHYRGHAVEFEKAAEIKAPVCKAVVYDKAFRAQGLHTVYSDRTVDEYTASGTDKGSAARFLLKTLGISRADAAAFGDNLNDIPMLSAVDNSYAPYTAKRAVRQASRFATTDILKTIQSL